MLTLIIIGLLFILGLIFVVFSKTFVKRRNTNRMVRNRRSNRGSMNGNPLYDRLEIIFGGLVVMGISGFYFVKALLEYLAQN